MKPAQRQHSVKPAQHLMNKFNKNWLLASLITTEMAQV